MCNIAQMLVHKKDGLASFMQLKGIYPKLELAA